MAFAFKGAAGGKFGFGVGGGRRYGRGLVLVDTVGVLA
ncbi:hypothetical protein ABIA38_006359 [Embleya sp. AB8]